MISFTFIRHFILSTSAEDLFIAKRDNQLSTFGAPEEDVEENLTKLSVINSNNCIDGFCLQYARWGKTEKRI